MVNIRTLSGKRCPRLCAEPQLNPSIRFMAVKKSELYSSLWASCDELRGGMDASQYKDYVLVLLFIKYVSDKYDGIPFAPITIPKGSSFKDMVALKGKTTVYDPTCGSGSLLLKVADEARTKVTLYGQEKDAATSGLARMNMILHDNPEATILQGNTLASPKFLDHGELTRFDYVCANPPFSDKRWSTGLHPNEGGTTSESGEQAYKKYPTLTETDIKTLVVDDKWMGTIATAVRSEIDRISQTFTQRVKELAERYDTPLPQLTDRVTEIEAKVSAHLAKMGFKV